MEAALKPAAARGPRYPRASRRRSRRWRVRWMLYHRFDHEAQVGDVEATLAAKPVDVTDAAGGKCPFGGDRFAPPALNKFHSPTQASPALLVETLRERFSTRLGSAEGHVAGRVLSNENQRALDELFVEPASLCCPITLMLLSDPVIASDGCVYERAAIQIIIEQGKLSPMTLTALEPQVFPAAKQKAKVVAFLAERAEALIQFADKHGEGLVVPESKRSGQPKKPTPAEAKTIVQNELGLEGGLKQILEEAAEQLGVDITGKTLVDIGAACVDALGMGQEANKGEGGVAKLEEWEKRMKGDIAVAAMVLGVVGGEKEAAAFETMKMVANALDRAQLYLSMMIASKMELDTTKRLATKFHKLTSAMERPMSVDILGLASPNSSVELKLRVMTGDEAIVLVPATATVQKVIDIAVGKTGASKDKERALVKGVNGVAFTRLLQSPISLSTMSLRARCLRSSLPRRSLPRAPSSQRRCLSFSSQRRREWRVTARSTLTAKQRVACSRQARGATRCMHAAAASSASPPLSTAAWTRGWPIRPSTRTTRSRHGTSARSAAASSSS